MEGPKRFGDSWAIFVVTDSKEDSVRSISIGAVDETDDDLAAIVAQAFRDRIEES